ncbi:hypothetical protein LC653_30340 [Nostoc sp. CHAB 5784]|uniref:hypothetical protein n=1 Tax=Nostoc mirabile TaxID=2907820 RepID=UPI001E549D4E|nr:hypothetical protein [Nostoc mirabile]MCC5668059.1 hypothetical protein [Nostoc mirabile CHAB5784]
MGSQRRGVSVAVARYERRQSAERGFPPEGTAERVSRLEATGVGNARLVRAASPLGEATGVGTPFSTRRCAFA